MILVNEKYKIPVFNYMGTDILLFTSDPDDFSYKRYEKKDNKYVLVDGEGEAPENPPIIPELDIPDLDFHIVKTVPLKNGQYAQIYEYKEYFALILNSCENVLSEINKFQKSLIKKENDNMNEYIKIFIDISRNEYKVLNRPYENHVWINTNFYQPIKNAISILRNSTDISLYEKLNEEFNDDYFPDFNGDIIYINVLSYEEQARLYLDETETPSIIVAKKEIDVGYYMTKNLKTMLKDLNL